MILIKAELLTYFMYKGEQMSTYNEIFKLTSKDVDLIELAARQQIGHLSQLDGSTQHKEPEVVDNHQKNY